MMMILKNYKALLFLLCISNAMADKAPKKKIGLANPASQYCLKKGGKLHREKGPGGGERSICCFGNNHQCEEWAMLRGHCPVGGVRITGYSTPAGIYCAIRGGKVLDKERKCRLPSGKICLSEEVYSGDCS